MIWCSSPLLPENTTQHIALFRVAHEIKTPSVPVWREVEIARGRITVLAEVGDAEPGILVDAYVGGFSDCL